MRSTRHLRTLCAAFLCLLLTASLIPYSHGAATITETVNLSRPQKNRSGSGYYWNNIKDILTLDGLNIDTDAEYGMKIPPDATVILNGNNTIRASRAALACPGNVIFKGTGTLTLISDDMGIYFYSSDDSTTARFLEGTFRITAGGDGIHSEATALSFAGSTVTISAPGTESYAVTGRSVKLFGGSVTADNSLHASLNLEVSKVSLDVTSSRAALIGDKKLVCSLVSITAGDSPDALSAVSEYGGENCVKTRSVASFFGSSVLFGENVSGFFDYLAVFALLALVAAGIAVPLLRTRRKNRLARETAARVAAEEAGKKQ